jgi:hypothetical protein
MGPNEDESKRRWVQTHLSTGDEKEGVLLALAKIETRIAATPAEGRRGLAVKLGLNRFLSEHADAASDQADSAYVDLVRLTNQDPATEIFLRRSTER